MQNKDLIIITLVVLNIYLYHQQTQQKVLPVQPNNQELQELRHQVNHYQTLYQKRVERDLEADQTETIKQLALDKQQLVEEFQNYKTAAENEKSEIISEKESQKNLFQQKIIDLETQLLNLAKQKIK